MQYEKQSKENQIVKSFQNKDTDTKIELKANLKMRNF